MWSSWSNRRGSSKRMGVYGRSFSPKPPRTFKKYKPERLYTLILEELSKYGKSKYGYSCTTAESLAKQFRVRVHLVTQIFHKLNLLGAMSRGINLSDIDGDWYATRYEVYSERVQILWKRHQTR